MVKKVKLIKLMLCIGVSILSIDAIAGYAANLSVQRLRVHNQFTYFGVDTQPKNTCSIYGEYIKFDHTTATGKSFLSILISAKTANMPIQIWYTDSVSVNTDQTSGCTNQILSNLTGVALQ